MLYYMVSVFTIFEGESKMIKPGRKVYILGYKDPLAIACVYGVVIGPEDLDFDRLHHQFSADLRKKYGENAEPTNTKPFLNWLMDHDDLEVVESDQFQVVGF